MSTALLTGKYLGYRGTIVLFKMRQENDLVHFDVEGIPFPHAIFKIICRAYNYVILAQPNKPPRSFYIKISRINDNTFIYEESVREVSAFKLRISKLV